METSKKNYCLNCLHSFCAKNKLKEHDNICKNHDYYYIEMSEERKKNWNKTAEKSLWKFHVIYADMESLLEKIDTCHNNPEKSLTTKTN